MANCVDASGDEHAGQEGAGVMLALGRSPRLAALILAGQKVEHYEIATYGGLRALAEALGHKDAAALLDETLGMCVEVHRQTLFKGQETLMYTAGLNVSFLLPVPTPSVLIVRAWLLRQDGRKWTLRAQIVGEDDRVLMETESLWISSRPSNPAL